MRYCAQYVTRQARRVPCDRPCNGYYCGLHGGSDADDPVGVGIRNARFYPSSSRNRLWFQRSFNS